MNGNARFWLIQVVGGIAVLGSYAAGLAAHPGSDALYGSMPDGLRSLYGVTMITAAIGYFPMTFFLWRHRENVRLGPLGGAALVDALYAMALSASVVWMPATFAFLDGGHSSTALWWLVRGVLWLVALASFGLVAAVLSTRPRGAAGALALAGSVAFTLQTGVLDAFVWPTFIDASLLP